MSTGPDDRRDIPWWQWLLLALGFLLALTLSFGAGYLAARGAGNIPVVIEKCGGVEQ